jgi:hypothetical protein
VLVISSYYLPIFNRCVKEVGDGRDDGSF